jgi:hypothetical protein
MQSYRAEFMVFQLVISIAYHQLRQPNFVLRLRGRARLWGKILVLPREWPRKSGAPTISDLDKPDFGDAVPMEPGELPVFWACSVTPPAAIAAARPSLRHHPRARPHAGDRPQKRPTRGDVRQDLGGAVIAPAA